MKGSDRNFKSHRQKDKERQRKTEGCTNRLDAAVAEARPCGKKGRGLFAARLIRARAWVASFGPTEPVEDQDIEQVQERIGYVLKVQNQGSSWKPIDEDASEAYKAMLANHQCSGPQEANVELDGQEMKMRMTIKHSTCAHSGTSSRERRSCTATPTSGVYRTLTCFSLPQPRLRPQS